jgi:hypothetical protein
MGNSEKAGIGVSQNREFSLIVKKRDFLSLIVKLVAIKYENGCEKPQKLVS